MSDYSLDQAVAQAVEPLEPLQDFYGCGSQVCQGQPEKCAGVSVPTSPLQMWFWDCEQNGWYAGTVQDSMDRSMRAYVLFWERTGWRLVGLQHWAQEDWHATLFNSEAPLITSHGSTAAIAICEAIKAAGLADAERATAETEVRG